MTISKQIENIIERSKKGKLLFVSDFVKYGDYDAVRKSLQRLTKRKKLIRIANGIYYYPKIDEILGILYPSIDTIAKAIAKRDKARIIPAGNYALYLLNLTEQIPMNVVFLTDASARKIKINNQQIIFKKTSPKNLLPKSQLINLIIQTFKTLKQENVNEKHLKIVEKHIKNSDDLEQIKREINIAPVWIRKIITQILKNIENELA
ncbi:MAG: hypothetical protein GXO80_10665 [Chlorobi bacterium]|nr:hypothetical protein [Chlorobiota bacterium]